MSQLALLIATCLLAITQSTSFAQTPGNGPASAPSQTNPRLPSHVRIGYAYWWPGGGPFTEHCAEEYALAAVGRVVSLSSTMPNHIGVDTRQGFVVVQEVLALNDDFIPHSDDKHFAVHVGDTLSGEFFTREALAADKAVLLTAYRYEGGLAATSKSVIPLRSPNDSLVTSLRRFISSDYCPQAIEADTSLWHRAGYGEALQSNLHCAESRPCR